MNVGDRVRIERDETRYPPEGTWTRFRGKTGTIVEINSDEYAVVFGAVKPRKDRPWTFRSCGDEAVTWFKAYEIRGLASERPAERRSAAPAVDDTRKEIARA
jgi:hypothetical protein